MFNKTFLYLGNETSHKDESFDKANSVFAHLKPYIGAQRDPNREDYNMVPFSVTHIHTHTKI